MFRFAVLIALTYVGLVLGHGRLEDPPGRSTMWRFGFNTEKNPDDAELFCGGITRHWQRNKGKCGICGDAWDLPEPRPHEDGGLYGKGVIAKTYKSGEVITATVNIVANHFGYFTFKICPVQPGVTVDQECLDKHTLELADGSGTKFDLGSKRGHVKVQLKLPEGFKCERCVFQWHWKCANHWGICENGKGRLGCGPQEYFRGCSDIRIE
ncbi:chitin-binding type-4 domain-containing protein [Nephila pilipes]|uniref:Chitin-binding type-4 domain-containing protein n=1 Tax=Nephila pilipes TaxID=299642 RepID=A0A8X6NXW6_NEPPI|nr:chitin-binding type-4 domain-containing protein [Nephila pilipes]